MTDPSEGVKPTTCPRCGYAMDCATIAVGDDDRVRPKPGDISLCIRCAQILVFDEENEPVMATDKDLTALLPEERRQLNLAAAALASVIRARNRS